jgi:carbonic anhydrase
MSVVNEVRSANEQYAATFDNVEERVRESVATIRGASLLPDSFGATGFVYHVESGRIEPV